MNASHRTTNFLSWPHSKAATIGAVLSAVFLVVLALNILTASDDQQNGFLVFATFLTAIGAVVGLVLSAVAFVRQHERSLLVWLPLVIGVLVVAFLAIEMFSGHG